MVNEAIRIGVEKNITSKLTLRNELYQQFKNDFHTSYINMAVFKAHALIKSYRKSLKKKSNTKRPYIYKEFLIVDSYYYKIFNEQIQIPTKPRESVVIPLNRYVSGIVSDPSLKLGNVTLTTSTLSIPFSKEVKVQKPNRYVGIDMNLDNITCFDSDEKIKVFDISSITKMKDGYRKAKSNLKRNDVRIRKKIFQKYGTKQKNKENAMLHKISKKLVLQNNHIMLEKLNGIRKLYRKGNGQGKRFRFKLNSWSRYKLQQQIVYKSKWNGVDTIFVNPRGTSSKCSICDAKIIEENRMIRCPKCGLHVDRDVNASRNILARGMRFVPDAVQGEVMKQFKDAEQIVPSLVVGG
jgi:putative transposase